MVGQYQLYLVRFDKQLCDINHQPVEFNNQLDASNDNQLHLHKHTVAIDWCALPEVVINSSCDFLLGLLFANSGRFSQVRPTFTIEQSVQQVIMNTLNQSYHYLFNFIYTVPKQVSHKT